MSRSNRSFSIPDIVNYIIPPPTYSENGSVTHTARILTTMSIVGIVFTVLYSLALAVIVPQQAGRLIYSVFGIAELSSTLLLLRLGRVRLASFVFLGGGWAAITLVTFSAGGTRAPFFAAYTVIIMLAVVLVGWRSATTIAILTCLVGLSMASLDNAGLAPALIATPLSGWLTQTTVMILLTSAAYLVVRRSNQALQRAQHELAEREKAEAALRESEERFRLISSVTFDYTFSSHFTAHGKLENAMLTGAFEAITGYTPQEFSAIGGWRAIVHPDDQEQDDRDLAALRTNRRVITEVRILKKGSHVRWVRVYAHPIWDAKRDELAGIYGAVQDITERKLAAQALRESEEKFRTIFELAPYGITIQEYNGKILAANRAFLQSIGLPKGQILGKNSFEAGLIDLETGQTLARELEETGRITNQEITIKRSDGRQLLMLVSSEQIHLAGQVNVLMVTVDITERKQAEKALQRSEALFRALLNATTDIAFLMSSDGTLLTLNETLARFLGQSVEELKGQNVFELLPTEVSAPRYERFELATQSQQPIRWEDSGTDGWWDNSIYPVLSGLGSVEAFAVYSRDITEQKRLAAELLRYTEQLQMMVDERTSQLRRAKDQIEIILNNTSDAVALAQPNGDVETRNPAFTALFGAQVSQTLEHILWAVSDDQQIVPVGKALMGVIYDRERQQIETKIASVDGTERDFDLLFIPVKSADEDDTDGILVSAHNITHLKEMERFKSRFIADALHDLATPISGLSTRLYLLKRSPENLAKHVQSLENQVDHIRNLLIDLRTLSELDHQQVALNLELCNVNNIVTRVFDTYEPVAMNKEQTLKLVLDPDLPDLEIDKRQMERVFVNIVSNAINYTPAAKVIHVQTFVDSGNVFFRVNDEGMGIGAEELGHIFERFYRTDEARMTRSSGTGLGLAIVKEIVELHGGSVSVKSTPGQGSTFTVRLPLKR